MRPMRALVGLVSRSPARVRVKLLAAFLAIVALLIMLGAVGLQVLSRVNHRTDDLIKLQRKIDAYRQVQHDTTSQLYSVSSALLSSDESALSSTLRQLTQFGYSVDRLQFVAKDEVELLDRFRRDYDQFTSVVAHLVDLIRAGRVAEARELQSTRAAPLADRLERTTNQLVNRAEADMVGGIEASDEAYAASQWMFVAFALASIALALILGYAISWSLIGPITEVEVRLKQIAAGDFSQRLRVVNRDELGALAANVNGMSEQLGRLYQQLELANLAKARFLASASHDLRQPLHALNLFVDQLRDERSPAERNRLLGRVDTAVASMNELFDALLDISKLDAGVLTPAVSEFPVAHLLTRIETTFVAAAREKGLILRVVPNSAWIRSDFILLERILLNLVSNAVQNTARGGVVVGCRRRGDRVRIDVCDTGVGIPKNEQRKIFSEFYQLAAAQGDSRGGLGLGLAIVDRLCRLLDHPLELISAIDKGSRFSVSVPLAAATRPTVESSALYRTIVDSLAGKLIVVVDDDPLVLDGMCGLLKRWGCSVVTARSDDAALKALRECERSPDLIISDFRLAHGKTGLDVIERLRGAFGAAIPAFLISGDTAPARLQEASASGCHLLHKPVPPITLRAMVSQLIKTEGGVNGSGEDPVSHDPPTDRQSVAKSSLVLPPE